MSDSELPTANAGVGPEVDIEYCVPCGLLPAAEETSHALLERFGRRLSGLRLTPGHGGVFRIRVDGDVVFDKSRDGFDVEEIERRVAERVAANAPA